MVIPHATEALEKQQTGATLHGLQEKKKKSITARVKCQHYHTFLIGCFVSTFFFFFVFVLQSRITNGLLENCCWKTAVPQRSVEFKTSRVAAVYLPLVLSALQKSAAAAAGPGRVSSERMLVCSQLAVEATGTDAFGVISQRCGARIAGCKDNIAQPQLKASTSS